jgi:simple sugar transport system permease protein
MIEAVRRSALRASGALIPSIALVAVIAALVAAITAIVGYDPRVALGALWRGSLGTEYAVLSATLVRAIPLMLTGLAVTLAFTAGLMNIGAEGQLLVGATAAVGVGLATGESVSRLVTLPLELVLGGVAGALWAFIPAWWR